MKKIDYTQVVEDGAYANVGACIVDLMAAIRAIGIFLIVEELLINQVLSIIPRDCGRVNLVADSTGKSFGKNPQVQLEVRDLPSWSQQKLRSKAPVPSDMKMKISLCLLNFFPNGLLTAKGKH